MSALTSLAKALAVYSMAPQRLTVFRHLYISSTPIVIVPLTLAGETNAPLAAMVGSDRARPNLIVTRQPRERAERLNFAGRLASELLFPIETAAQRTQATSSGPNARVRVVDAPQIWVPNPAGVEFVRTLGRMTRLRQTEGPWAVPKKVRELGIWLTWFAEQAEFADTGALIAATRAVAAVWATGQSDLEDGNLAAQIAWLDPPEGMDVASAVSRAEDPQLCPPAGPATDPTFDRLFLEPALRDLATARTPAAHRAVHQRLTAMLEEQMRPTWELVWTAIGLLADVPEAPRVPKRWEQQRDRFTSFHRYVADGGRPQAKRDNAGRSAHRLAELEQRKAAFEAQRAYDDPLVIADHRLTGEAFSGQVVKVDATRRVPGLRRSVLRPLVLVATGDHIHFDVGQHVYDPARNGQQAVIESVAETEDGWRVALELQNRMGSGQTAKPGSVPALGEDVTYTSVTETFVRRRPWPAREETPWTHGGPAPDSAPAVEDAAEDWS
ncbi:hypothetical protein GCM10010124_31070 [Pilimelia terevasa]|uniref:Uncharacterized protein n=1 Tax=Pilimelia terevasa TaxID=53372 RepID=A0A8J3FLN4_9ACTN|nr:hypothetical protein [Pilimelia terevasa]GGK36243.1 hypothetical protein GCM10010124_31070 [Pilimelia terevasa]